MQVERASQAHPSPFAAVSLFLALMTTGLSVGFFYAWQVGAIPGLRLLDDVTYYTNDERHQFYDSQLWIRRYLFW